MCHYPNFELDLSTKICLHVGDEISRLGFELLVGEYMYVCLVPGVI